MKKLVALLTALLIVLTGMVGCKGVDDGGELAEFKNRPNEVIVYFASNAYGQDWINEIARKYMTDHNTDTFINVKKTVTQTEELAKIESGISVGDLYMLDCHLEEKVFAYESIADVYDSYPIGETEKKISEKILPAYLGYYTNSGAGDYIMPKASIGIGYQFAYNKTVLDSILPDGYTLPRTTNELLELGTKIKDDAYLLINSFGDSSDYGKYMYNGWFAQLIGMEAYQNFRMGRYYDDATGKWLFNEEAPTYYEKQKEAIQEYVEILRNIYTLDNGYIHENSVDMTAMDAEAVFAGYGFGQNLKPGVFMINGSYVEQEMGWMLEEQKAVDNAQEIRMMQMPVASGIISRTPSISSDSELRTVIDYVDKVLMGESATKPEGVEDADIEIIKESRTISALYMAGGMVIPKAANNVEGAKDFIRYLASDEAAIIAARYTNGTNLLPFGKSVTEEELGFERTPFMKDCVEMEKKISNLCSSDSQEFKFTYVTKLAQLNGTGTTAYLRQFYTNKFNSTKDVVYQNSLNEVKTQWNRLVTEFKNQGGDTSND